MKEEKTPSYFERCSTLPQGSLAKPQSSSEGVILPSIGGGQSYSSKLENGTLDNPFITRVEKGIAGSRVYGRYGIALEFIEVGVKNQRLDDEYKTVKPTVEYSKTQLARRRR